jgi:taurine dioxygenase
MYDYAPPTGDAPPLEQMLPIFDRTALGVAREYEAMGDRPISVELEARAAGHGITFEHLGLTLGSVLHGVDLRALPDPELVAVIRSALLERKVIFFRDQHLSEEQQTTFGRCFGDLDAFPFGKPGNDPFILEIIHGDRSPGTENGWHTDVTWMERPSLGSIAQMITAPPYGGDTLFADSHAALLGLPADVRERIEHLDTVNDYRIFLRSRDGTPFPDDIVEALKTDIPFGVTHPLVRTHPETGKQALYLHGGFMRQDHLVDRRTAEPIDAQESMRLSKTLLAQHARPEYGCRFSWQEGSIAFWDNRAVQHYAASDYFPHRRVLRRVTVAGDRPFHRPD